jgi:hypothetical protein
VHGDLGDFRSGDAAVEAAAEVARLDRCAVPGGEDQAGVDPGVSRAFPVGLLLLPAELQCRDAQVREGERGLGCFGLGLAAKKLAANTLELLADVQFGGIEVG